MPRPFHLIACLAAIVGIILLVVLPPDVAQSSSAVGPYKGIWLSKTELDALPTSGPAFTQAKQVADGSLGTPNISDQNSDHDVKTLAAALLYQATGDNAYRAKAANAIMSAVGTEKGGRTLALARNLPSYVIAADLINLPDFNASYASSFRSWLLSLKTEVLSDGKTLTAMREARPNNWGTHGGAAVAALNLYLGDTAAVAREATVFKGWVGDRSSYAGFKYGDLSWQSDRSNPVGINPVGATIQGHVVDGVLPDDQRRAGGFTWPPPCENYVREALGPAVVEAALLERAGYPAASWQSGALNRAVIWLEDNGCSFSGDDEWIPHLVNWLYGTDHPAVTPARYGKGIGFVDWTHATNVSPPPPDTTPTDTTPTDTTPTDTTPTDTTPTDTTPC